MHSFSQKGTTFSWKRKAGENLSKSVSQTFESHSSDDVKSENEILQNGNIDWLSLSRPSKSMKLEDALIKSSRLQREGVTLAETERYWEATKKFDEAIDLTPNVAKLYEMKAQSLLLLLENHPAALCAQKAIEMEPTWWVPYQTLGRIHLSMGEVGMAVKDFVKAIHLNPIELELWEDDLKWASSLLQQKQANELEIKENSSKKTDKNSGHKCVIEDINIDSTSDSDERLRDARQLDSSRYNDILHTKETTEILTNVPQDYVQMRDNMKSSDAMNL